MGLIKILLWVRFDEQRETGQKGPSDGVNHPPLWRKGPEQALGGQGGTSSARTYINLPDKRVIVAKDTDKKIWKNRWQPCRHVIRYRQSNQTARHRQPDGERGTPERGNPPEEKNFSWQPCRYVIQSRYSRTRASVKRSTFAWSQVFEWLTTVSLCATQADPIHQTERSQLYRDNHCTLKTTQCASVPLIATEHTASVFSAYRNGKQGTQAVILCSRL